MARAGIQMAQDRSQLPQSLPRPEHVIEKRFEQGSVCVYQEKDGALRGYIWLQLGDFQEDEVRAVFAPSPIEQTVWDFDVYVDPDYRLSRSFSRLWQAVNAELRERGVRWSHSRISAFNPGSIRVHEKLGAVRTGWAVFLCIGKLQCLFSCRAPYAHFSKSSRPRVVIGSPNNPIGP